MDDGSTDQTGAILKAYGDKIRVIRRQNGGASAARNTGIKAAKGEIISFLDSDDEWLALKTERQVKLLQRTKSSGVVCCVCNAGKQYSSGTVTSFQTAGLHPEQTEGVWSNSAHILIDRFFFFNQVAAVWREALDHSGYFREDLHIMEDYDLALRLSITGSWAFIADALVIWHEDAGSGLSRNVGQLDKCQLALQILNDLSNSTQFGPLLPRARLLHRRLLLKHEIHALVLFSQPSYIRRLSGKSLLLCLRIYGAICRRLPFTSQMITRAVLAHPESSGLDGSGQQCFSAK